jgi:hypothetical protein
MTNARQSILPLLLVVCAVLSGVAHYVVPSFWHGESYLDSGLCGECGHVATALSNGRGYSDPFGVETGPTAWVAPVMPFIVAGLMVFFADLGLGFTYVYYTFYAFKILALLLSVLALMRIEELRNERYAIAGVAICVFLAYHHSYFGKTDDEGLLAILAAGVLVTVCANHLTNGRCLAIGLLGGACALSSPVLALAWASAFAFSKFPSREFSKIALVLGVAVMAVLPWVARNYYVFDTFVPVKSNFGFELWQSQCFDDDGVLDSSMSKVHPSIYTNAENEVYWQRGELAYIEEKRQIAIEAISNAPSEYGRRVWNRFVAACLIPVGSHWELTWYLRLVSRATTFFAATWFLFVGRDSPLFFRASSVGYLMYLVPYVACSYYDRYMLPLLPFQATIIVGIVIRFKSLLQKGECHAMPR